MGSWFVVSSTGRLPFRGVESKLTSGSCAGASGDAEMDAVEFEMLAVV